MRITESKTLRSLYEGALRIPNVYTKACGINEVEASAEVSMVVSALHTDMTAHEVIGSGGNLREEYGDFVTLVEAALCALYHTLGEGKTRLSRRAVLMGATMADVHAARALGVADSELSPAALVFERALLDAEEKLSMGDEKVELLCKETLGNSIPETVESVVEGIHVDLSVALTLLGKSVVKAAMNDAAERAKRSAVGQPGENPEVILNLTGLAVQTASLAYFLAKRRKDAGATLPAEWEALADSDTVFEAVSPFVIKGAQEAAGPTLRTAVEDENGEVREVAPEEIQRAFLNDVRGRES